MPAAASATPEHIKNVNTRYHDAAAASYDAKWGIDYGEIGMRQVRAKVSKALGGEPESAFGDALEIGSGTGYFSLNLLQLGLVERVTATDISPGMLAALRVSARRLRLDVATTCTEAEALPFADQSFDLVFGHAVLHHIPDLPRAFGEFHRVLRPGGALIFCGEPSRYGDRIATVPKRAGVLAAPLWRRMVGASALPANRFWSADGNELEPEVDVHAFTPSQLRGLIADAGFGQVHLRGEELVANAYGWWLRTLESSAEPDQVPFSWRHFAYRSYMALQHVDSSLLEPRLPPELFYNLVLSARKA
jgi:SAM-dependent methyltransferase